jgi:hypothetical protein
MGADRERPNKRLRVFQPLTRRSHLTQSRPQKITLAEFVTAAGCLSIADYRGHVLPIAAGRRRLRSAAMTGLDDVRPSDIEARFVWQASGKRGADVRPDFNWNKLSLSQMGCR